MAKYSTFICEVCLQIDPNDAVVQTPSDRRIMRVRFVDEKVTRSVTERNIMYLCRKHQVALSNYLDSRTNGEMSLAKKLALMLIHAKEIVGTHAESPSVR